MPRGLQQPLKRGLGEQQLRERECPQDMTSFFDREAKPNLLWFISHVFELHCRLKSLLTATHGQIWTDTFYAKRNTKYKYKYKFDV